MASKWLFNQKQFVFWNANPCIADLNMGPSLIAAGLYIHMATARRKFNRVRNKIDQNLKNSAPVSPQRREPRGRFKIERYLTFGREISQKPFTFTKHFTSCEAFFVQGNFTSFNALNIENLVDQLKQMAATKFNILSVGHIFFMANGAKNLMINHIGKAKYAV